MLSEHAARCRLAAAPRPAPRPSGAGSRGSTRLGALDDHRLAAETPHHLRDLDAGRRRHPGRAGAAGPPSCSSPRGCPTRPPGRAARDRGHERLGAGRHDDVARPCGGRRRPRRRRSRPAVPCRAAGRCPGPPASAPARRRSSSTPCSPARPARPARRPARLRPTSRAPCTASPGRSSDFDGMHAQYEHSPPTSSRSTTATRSPRAGQRRRAVLAGAPPPSTITS